MADIYQEIWTADMESNGLEAIFSNQIGDKDRGFVAVNSELGHNFDSDLRVLSEVRMPETKRKTYDLCRKLFNNYALPEKDLEIDSEKERFENHQFVEAIINSPPMLVARDYIEKQTQTPVSDERWHTTIIDHWFRRYSMGGDPHLSGFEHVIVGEQEKGKVQGYHFWYKYYLDDGYAKEIDDDLARFPGLEDDRITYIKSYADTEQMNFPESVTIGYRWDAPDYEREAIRPLFKKIGGFFVGCSVEGLMALGTVRAHVGANAPKVATIEGARYQMKLFRSDNNRHIRTFYPVFLNSADPVNSNTLPPRPNQPIVVTPGQQGDVRILSAIVNPHGADPSREFVTLINVGPTENSISRWTLRDKNEKRTLLPDLILRPGIPEVILLDGKGVQLSNKGSTINLVREDGVTVHQVSYSKSQAKRENRTILFT